MTEPVNTTVNHAKVAQLLVAALAAGLSGQMETMMAQGLAEDDLVAMLSNAIAGVIARAEPDVKRQQLTMAATSFIPQAVERYRLERHKTPGGVILPTARGI